MAAGIDWWAWGRVVPRAIFVLDSLGVNALRSEAVVQLLLFADAHMRQHHGRHDRAMEVLLLAIDGDVSGRELVCEWLPGFSSPGVSFAPLPEPEIAAPGFPEHQQVYAVLEALKDEAADEIHFLDTGGHGYYLTLAKRCGLHLLDTTLVTHIVGSTLFFLEAADALVENESALMLDFFECESTRFADVVVVHDRKAWDWYRRRLPASTAQVCDLAWAQRPAAVSLPAAAPFAQGQRPIRFVFLGVLGQESGLRGFCDAVSLLVKKENVPFEVVFVGETRAVGAADAVSYIRIRAQNWKVPVRIERHLTVPEEIELAARSGSIVFCDVSRRESMRARMFESLGHPMILVGGIASDLHDATPARIVERLQHIRCCLGDGHTLDLDIASVWSSGRHWNIEPVRAAPLADAVSPPLVSIVVTHFSRPEKLRFALASLRKQTYRNFEVIVVDDGSPDEAVIRDLEAIEDEIKPLGWRVIRQPNRYLGAARNRGAEAARGDYLLFMDDDNCAKPDELSTLVAVALRLDAEIVAPFYHGFEADEDVVADRPTACFAPVGGDLSFAVFSPALGDANALYSRELFRRIGGFTEDYGITHEDWELHVRADLAGARRVTVPRPLFWYRVDPAGMYRNQLMQLHRNANLRRHIRPYLDAMPHYQAKLVQLAQGLSVSRHRTRSAGPVVSPQQAQRSAPGPLPFARVAVIVRTKDRPLMLQRAVGDILGQTFKDWKIVVVNDGGDVDTLNLVLEQFAEELEDRLIVLNNPVSLGMQTASNVGIDTCESDFIVIHDDDDTWQPTFLARAVECMDAEGWNPRVAGVVTWSEVIVEQIIDGYEIVETDRFIFNDKLRSLSLVELGVENRFPPISFLFRRTAFDEVGHFREDFGVLGDWDFHLRVLESFDIRVIAEPLAGYHHRPEATSGAYGNSVHAQRDVHIAKRMEMVNSFLRRSGTSTDGPIGQLLLQGQLYKNNENDQSARFQKLHDHLWEVEQRMTWWIGERPKKKRFSLAGWLPRPAGAGNLVENGDFRDWPGPREVFGVKTQSTGIACPGLLVTFDGHEKTYSMERMTSDGRCGLPKGKTYLRVVNRGQASTDKWFWLECPIQDVDAIAGQRICISGKARLKGVYEWISVGGRVDLPDRTKVAFWEQKVFLSEDFQPWSCTVDCPPLGMVDHQRSLARIHLKLHYSESFIFELTDFQVELGEHPRGFRYVAGHDRKAVPSGAFGRARNSV